jgi:hypothetical protein
MAALLGFIKAFIVTGVGEERSTEQSELWKLRPIGSFVQHSISALAFFKVRSSYPSQSPTFDKRGGSCGLAARGGHALKKVKCRSDDMARLVDQAVFVAPHV